MPNGRFRVYPPPAGSPREAGGTAQGVRFPLLAGGTLRRGFTKNTIEEVCYR